MISRIKEFRILDIFYWRNIGTKKKTLFYLEKFITVNRVKLVRLSFGRYHDFHPEIFETSLCYLRKIIEADRIQHGIFESKLGENCNVNKIN